MARHPTQLYAAGLELLIAFYLFRIEARIPKAQRQVGYIFWTWLALHGVARMFNEVFRQDPRGNLILGMGISFWIGALLVILAGLRLKHPTLSEK